MVPGWMLDAKLLAGNQAPRDSLASFADVDVRGLRLDGRDVVVVGGGMRACALALAAHERGARRVTLMSRGEIRIAERECDASFFGNKGVRAFRAAREPAARLEALRRARSGRASVDARTWSRVREAEEVREGARRFASSGGDRWSARSGSATTRNGACSSPQNRRRG